MYFGGEKIKKKILDLSKIILSNRFSVDIYILP